VFFAFTYPDNVVNPIIKKEGTVVAVTSKYHLPLLTFLPTYAVSQSLLAVAETLRLPS